MAGRSSISPRVFKIAVIGCGVIFDAQHKPAIARSANFQLVATVDPAKQSAARGVPHYRSIEELVTSGVRIDVVAVCTPSTRHYQIARTALLAGWDVILEKPPTLNTDELGRLETKASSLCRVLITLWHSQHAPAVGIAMAQLGRRNIREITVTWEEDFHEFHPGQSWVTKKAAGGIFDPLVNALSMLEKILDTTVVLTRGVAEIPANWEAAISGTYKFIAENTNGFPIRVKAAWRAGGSSRWVIAITTAVSGEEIKLIDGGAGLEINGVAYHVPSTREYDAGYEHCAARLVQRLSDVQYGPLQALIDGQDRSKVTFTGVEAFSVNK